MSIESDLNRIANALEVLVQVKTGGKVASVGETSAALATVTTTVAGKKKEKTTAAEPQPLPVEEKTYTQPEVLEALKAHADAIGSDDTIALMKKHGADKDAPAVRTIPAQNYAALMADVEKDMKKKKGTIA